MMRSPLIVSIALIAILVSAPTLAEDDVATETEAVAEPDYELELDTTTIKGNRELPKVLAIVPWKKALPPELAGQPDTSLLEQVLVPLDRDVFQRELRYLSNSSSENETDSADNASALSSDGRARPEE